MKAPLSFPARLRRGVALVIVLGCLVLLSVTVIGFTLSVQTNLQSSKAFSDVNASRRLSEMAVNVVQTQIRAATTEAGTAWASQPGMIRTFDTAGNLSKVYRLYSAENLVSGSLNLSEETSALSNWSTTPALYTDLNEPVPGASGSLVYPILTATTANIEGYSISGAPVSTATNANPAPMPGRWIYILRNGEMAAPAISGTTVEVPGASGTNPIIGRIAFWTDDETCKVNINTASEGRPWTTPRYGGSNPNDDEKNLVFNAPVNGEYQRYPGHPATVSLSAVFPNLATMPPAAPNPILYALAPRIVDGGSKGGSVVTGSSSGAALVPTLTPDSDRLYASVDELLFSGTLADLFRVSQGGFTQDTLAQAAFFLTNYSRAPELNLFGLPRVSIWPVDSDFAANPLTTRATPYDKLSAFCTTCNGHPFYFQRHDSDSPTADYDNIQRNRELYSYLHTLMDSDIPGFGGRFSTKYSTDRDQILTEIFDYIRCTNLYDDNLGNTYGTNTPPTFKQFTDARSGTTGRIWAGHGQVTPIQIGDTMGFGRFVTISEIGMLIICTADGNGKAPTEKGSLNDPKSVSNLISETTKLTSSTNVPTTVTVNGNPYTNPTLADTYGGEKTALGTGEKRLQAVLLLNCFVPSLGWEALQPDLEVEVEGLNNMGIGGKLPFPSDNSGKLVLKSPNFNPGVINIYGDRLTGGDKTFRYLMSRFSPYGSGTNSRVNGWRYKTGGSVSSDEFYPFVSAPFTVTPKPDGSIPFGSSTTTVSGTTVTTPANSFTVRVYACTSGTRVAGAKAVQTFNVTFPATDIPTPDLLSYGIYMDSSPTPALFAPWGTANTGMTATLASDWWGFDNRINWASASPGDGGRDRPQLAGTVIRIDSVKTRPDDWQLATSSTRAAFSPGYFKDSSINSYATLDDGFPSDVVRSIASKYGDVRLTACQATVDTGNDFLPPYSGRYKNSSAKLVHAFRGTTPGFFPGNMLNGRLVPASTNVTYGDIGDPRFLPAVPGDVSGNVSLASNTGDWDAGLPYDADGPYINKPDEGSPSSYLANANGNWGGGTTFFTPNRLVSSAGMFGSLPTHVKRSKPWTTLLFRPDPKRTHPNSAEGPKDYLLMDLFQMPVVEPYAISETLSTSGKVNMNYQIMPYTYITRSTALGAAMRGLSMSAVPNTAGLSYKGKDSISPPLTFSINRKETDGTLRQFKERFDAGNIFRSATEICDIFLVPGVSFPNSQGTSEQWTSEDQALSFWDKHQLTGDNVRERPYADLYALLTTKSNTYQVHYRVQSLQKIKSDTNQARWIEGRDTVTGESRGSVVLERYLDPADTSLGDPATATGTSLESKYKFRVLKSILFTP